MPSLWRVGRGLRRLSLLKHKEYTSYYALTRVVVPRGERLSSSPNYKNMRTTTTTTIPLNSLNGMLDEIKNGTAVPFVNVGRETHVYESTGAAYFSSPSGDEFKFIPDVEEYSPLTSPFLILLKDQEGELHLKGCTWY